MALTDKIGLTAGIAGFTSLVTSPFIASIGKTSGVEVVGNLVHSVEHYNPKMVQTGFIMSEVGLFLAGVGMGYAITKGIGFYQNDRKSPAQYADKVKFLGDGKK